MLEDAGRGWRRVVPSPEPNEIVELEAIRDLLDGSVLVICSNVRYDTPEQQALSAVSVAEMELCTAERRAVEDGPRKVGPDVGAGGWMSR